MEGPSPINGCIGTRLGQDQHQNVEQIGVPQPKITGDSPIGNLEEISFVRDVWRTHEIDTWFMTGSLHLSCGSIGMRFHNNFF